MSDEPSFLDRLRDLQDREPEDGPATFAEWRQEQALKAAGRSVAHLAPGVGMMGHLNTSSNAPTGPRDRRSGNRGVGFGGDHGSATTYDPGQFYNNPPYGNDWASQFGVQAGVQGTQPSQYRNDRVDQPPPWIDDVDMQSIWYSPYEPVWPFGPPYYNRPREWNYPVGYNLNYVPQRMQTYGMLRGMRSSWGVLAAVEATRMDQLLRLPWTIQRRDKPKATSAGVDAMRRFFRRPDGKLSFGQWARKLLFDLFDIDAPCLFVDRDRAGRLQSVEVLDGATIFPLIDDAGRRPDTTLEVGQDGITYIHRQPAFQQIIYGLPMINLSEDELIYAMMRPRPELPMFGYSPIEQMLTETTEAIRKTFYQAEFWRSGSMPEMIITVPDVWTPRQIATFQAHFDALLSGQLTLKSKVRFVPGGMKPFDIKNASGESLWSQRDELLVRLACYVFSVSPTPFIRQMNRATAQNAQQTAQEEGLYPLMSWFKDDIMDRIIQDIAGLHDTEFVFLPRPEVDLEKQSKIHQVQIDEGLRSRNEIRTTELGEEPIEGGDIITVKTASGVVPLDLVVSGQAMAPGSPGAPPPDSKPKPTPEPPAGGTPQRGTPRSRQSGNLPPIGKGATYDAITDAANDAEAPASHEQKEAGNYRKGHVRVAGLPISVETPRGRKRVGRNPDGSKWKSRMAGHYGYIRGTLASDGDQLDVCVGRHPKSNVAFVIDQIHDGTGQFDEPKVMLGYRGPKAALRDYLDSNGDGLGGLRSAAMTQMTIQELKNWIAAGGAKRPAARSGFGTRIGSDEFWQNLHKSGDTISTATGLSWYDQTVPIRRKPTKKARKRLTRSRGPRWLELGA